MLSSDDDHNCTCCFDGACLHVVYSVYFIYNHCSHSRGITWNTCMKYIIGVP